LGTILWCNLPDAAREQALGRTVRSLSPEGAYRVRQLEWLARYGAHLAGLDNKWQMYGGQSRFNWSFVITGAYADEQRKVERQLIDREDRYATGWRRRLFGFKEAKFQLNIYGDPVARESYARYLARQRPEWEGLPIARVRYELQLQYILPPLVAVREQRLLEPETYRFPLQEIDLRPTVDALRLTRIP
jgi:hypothetical protein